MIEKGIDYNLIWTGYTTVDDILPLNKYQKINHYPNSVNLGRKDLMWRNMLKMKLKFLDHFSICPHSWVIPDQYEEFNQFKSLKKSQDKFFILKPTNSSCGRGIRVV